MDLSNAEKTLSELEENSKKISEITKSIEKFKKISQELSSLPDDIEKNNSATGLRIVDESEKLKKLIDKSSKELTSIFNEAQNNYRDEIHELRTKLEKIETNINKQFSSVKRNNIVIIVVALIIIVIFIS